MKTEMKVDTDIDLSELTLYHNADGSKSLLYDPKSGVNFGLITGNHRLVNIEYAKDMMALTVRSRNGIDIIEVSGEQFYAIGRKRS